MRCPLCSETVTVPQPAGQASVPIVPLPYNANAGRPTHHGLAVAALVCGILGLVMCPVVGLTGVILGIVALSKAGKAPSEYGGRGMAVAGICTGGAGLLLLPLLISILLPSLSRARELAKRTVCSANMRAIGLALYTYAEDGDPFPEVGADWQARLFSAGNLAPKDLICPSDTITTGTSYHYVPGYSASSDPAQIILFEDPAIHRDEGGNLLFLDGHVEFVQSPRYEQMIDSITLPDGRPYTPDQD
ncbi:MAG: DUF4190 domain-containing protein [Phycisphaerae bacterium]